MTDKVYEIFSKTFELPIDLITDDLSYQSVEPWDSIGHMNLITALDEAFDVMLSNQDVVDMLSVAKAKAILEKYHVFDNEQ